jgi:hypothetical protein
MLTFLFLALCALPAPAPVAAPSASPPATTVVDAHAEPAPTPLRKLRSGRPWPSHHYSRLPGKPADGPAAQRPLAPRRGWWRAR